MMSYFTVVSFLITLLLASTHGQETVKDTDGKDVLIGQQYFIQPIKNATSNGGGLVPAPISLSSICPLGIVQTLISSQPGLPVSLSNPSISKTTVVDTSSNVNIEFKSNIWPYCNKFSKVWAVEDSPSDPKEPSIIIGGKRGSRNSEFKIEKARVVGANTYKLTSLTGSVGGIPGILLSAPQLILTNDDAKTVLVKFNKVDDVTTTTTTSTSRVEKLIRSN